MRDVLIFSIFPVLFGMYMIIASVMDYHYSQQFDDWWSRRSSLSKSLGKRVLAAKNFPKAMSYKLWLSPEETNAPVIRLNVRRDLWTSWKRDGLSLWGQWIDAAILRGNDIHPVKLRNRGDTSVHWATEKKSFTLKTPKSSLFKGYRRLAFSGKTILPQYLTGRLADEFGLLAPFTTITPVFINDQFYGLFKIAEVVNESFLRQHGKIPGNIFRGDTAERGEYFKGLPRHLFINPYIWDRTAVNDRPSAYAWQQTLQEFLHDLNGTTFEDHIRLMSWIDRKEIASLVALMLVVGDPYHMSGVHNQFWYEDPSSGLLHLIPMDLRLLDLRNWGGARQLNKFLCEVLKNPLVLDDVFSILYKKIVNDKLIQTTEQIVSSVYNRYENFFKYEQLRKYLISDVGSPEEILSLLKNNVNLLKEWINDSKIAMSVQNNAANSIIVDFEARGYVGSNIHDIEIRGNLEGLEMVKLVADRNLNGMLDESDTEVSVQWKEIVGGGRLTLEKPVALLPGFDPDKKSINPAPIHYRFFIKTSGLNAGSISGIQACLRNRLTGKNSEIIRWNDKELVSKSESWHPWQYNYPSSIEHRLSGEIYLRNTLVIPDGNTLIIEAGTTIRMDPEASIISRGRVRALGAEDDPIIFRPAVEGRPWGGIALQGEGAKDSVFEHVHFVGGGGALIDRVEYKGMVNVYWANGVSFRHCNFADNVRSDDAFNAANANVELQDCTFIRTNADAIDFDYSSGIISNCIFEDTGNDAIDLMTSSPDIMDNYITDAKDKGISIGEKSNPFVFNNNITNSHTGVEIKDCSEPLIVNNLITNNNMGVHQYIKNWRYGVGGWAKLVNSVVIENNTDFSSDKNTRQTMASAISGNNFEASSGKRVNSSISKEIAWIFAHYGILPETYNDGLIDKWTQNEIVKPIISVKFNDDFGEIADSWGFTGGTTRLVKREHNLEMSFRRKESSIFRGMNWDLSNQDYDYIAVFEISGQNFDVAKLSLISDDTEISSTFKPTQDLSSYLFLTVELKPALYRKINIKATSGNGTGCIKLHSYSIYAIPKNVQL
jgi:parallel beta-helix repeat protein